MRKECDAVYDLKRTYGVGDYLILVVIDDVEHKLLFERKTASDFIHTVHMEGRLNDQLDGVDGLIFEKLFVPKMAPGWWVRLYSTLNGVAHHHPVFYTLSPKHTMRQLRMFEEKVKKGEWGVMRKPIVIPPVTSSENEEQVRCLMGFPGMGEKRANDVLAHYGTLESALKNIPTWSQDVKGIGRKTQTSSEAVFGRSYVRAA